MNRKVALLSGFAIIAVVVSHAARWAYAALFGWQGELSPVLTPSLSQAAGLGYYSLAFIQQLPYFSVPAFLFISGFFIAYAAQGGVVSWKMLRTRIYKLLWPYFIWSLVVFILQAFQGRTFSVGEYLVKLLTGKTLGPFYYIPMLIQFFLLSPFLYRLGKKHPVVLLTSAAAIQLMAVGYYYLVLGRANLPAEVINYTCLFVWYMFYFPLGLAAGLRLKSFQSMLARYRKPLMLLTIVFGVLSILEGELLLRATGHFELSHDMIKLSTSLYAVTFILTFLSLNWGTNRLVQIVNQFGLKSYGIYLLSTAVLFLLAHIIARVAPQLLSQSLIMTIVLTVAGLGVVTLVMDGVARSRLRFIYRYLFG